jgi:hypothetical protein
VQEIPENMKTFFPESFSEAVGMKIRLRGRPKQRQQQTMERIPQSYGMSTGSSNHGTRIAILEHPQGSSPGCLSPNQLTNLVIPLALRPEPTHPQARTALETTPPRCPMSRLQLERRSHRRGTSGNVDSQKNSKTNSGNETRDLERRF